MSLISYPTIVSLSLPCDALGDVDGYLFRAPWRTEDAAATHPIEGKRSYSAGTKEVLQALCRQKRKGEGVSWRGMSKGRRGQCQTARYITSSCHPKPVWRCPLSFRRRTLVKSAALSRAFVGSPLPPRLRPSCQLLALSRSISWS